MTLPIDIPLPSIVPSSNPSPSISRSGNTGSSALNSSTPADKKLRAAAAEFESLLLSNLWKSMKSTFADSDDDSDDAAHATLEDIGIQAMSSAVGKAGGLGLGKLILKHLEPKLEHSHDSNPAQSGKAFAAPADIPP